MLFWSLQQYKLIILLFPYSRLLISENDAFRNESMEQSYLNPSDIRQYLFCLKPKTTDYSLTILSISLNFHFF